MCNWWIATVVVYIPHLCAFLTHDNNWHYITVHRAMLRQVWSQGTYSRQVSLRPRPPVKACLQWLWHRKDCMARSVRFEARGPILGTCPRNSTHQLKSVGNDCDGGGKTTWRGSGLKSVDGQHGSSAHTLSRPGPRPSPPLGKGEQKNWREEGGGAASWWWWGWHLCC